MAAFGYGLVADETVHLFSMREWPLSKAISVRRVHKREGY